MGFSLSEIVRTSAGWDCDWRGQGKDGMKRPESSSVDPVSDIFV